MIFITSKKNTKISEKLKGNTNFKDKNHSEESKKKISDAIKKKWQDKNYRKKQKDSKPEQIRKVKITLQNPEVKQKMSDAKIGKDPWNKGKTDIYSEKTKKQISDSVKKLYDDDEYRKRNEKILIDARKKSQPRISSIEIIMAKELSNRNISFIQQKIMLGKYRVDFLIDDDTIIIECDGLYWHNLPGIQKKDKIRDKILEEKGFIVLRFWEDKIRNNISQCVDKIEEYLP